MKEVWFSEDGDFSEIEDDGFYHFYLYKFRRGGLSGRK